jgi:hypothetical protein
MSGNHEREEGHADRPFVNQDVRFPAVVVEMLLDLWVAGDFGDDSVTQRNIIKSVQRQRETERERERQRERETERDRERMAGKETERKELRPEDDRLP